MAQRINYGDGGRLELDVPAESVVADFRGPEAEPLDDPVAAVAAALADPCGFPPLESATVPGDRIVLALDRAVPQADAVVAGTVLALLAGRARPDDIRLIRTAPGRGEPLADPLRLLPEPVRSRVGVELHDGARREELSYLAASRDANPIYFNRAILDADLVLPIGCARAEQSPGYLGIHGGLFPTFSDEATQQRFRLESRQRRSDRARQRAEVDEAAWLLGIQLVVQAIPGPGDALLDVVAGAGARLSDRSRQLCDAAWSGEVPSRAGLVVATIEGGPQQQTWDSFARALASASRVVCDEGAIVLCTELAGELGPSLESVALLDDDETLARKLDRDRTPDVLAAKMLVDARRRCHVYLISRLDADLVEALGMYWLESPDHVDHLARRHDSCILLSNAQHAVLTPRTA